MSGTVVGAGFFCLMLVLLALRVPIAVSMFITGAAGYITMAGLDPLLSYLKTVAYGRYSIYDLSVVPLFLLMGNFASRGGLSKALFAAAEAMIGHYRGGIAMAAVGACAGFGAICGSSLATAATMGQVALPELRRFNYSPGLATATLAAGGTLGILIPPSIVLVIYAILTEQNIAKLFLAAFLPGILAALGYMLAIAIFVRLYPGSGPAGDTRTWGERISALIEVWPVLVIFVTVIGGIYGGVFTPTEAAAVAALHALLLAGVVYRALSWRTLYSVFLESTRSSAVITMIIAGAFMLNYAFTSEGVPQSLALWVDSMDLSQLQFLLLVNAVFLVLGCFLDVSVMLLVFVPMLLPAAKLLGIDLVHFGVVVVVNMMIGLVTPPFGMLLFVTNALTGISIRDMMREGWLFLVMLFALLFLMVLFPQIVLWLPQSMGYGLKQ